MIPKFADADAHDVDRFLKKLLQVQSDMPVVVTGTVLSLSLSLALI